MGSGSLDALLKQLGKSRASNLVTALLASLVLVNRTATTANHDCKHNLGSLLVYEIYETPYYQTI